ncbi:treslin-like [Tachypleus tridentatus]|uniref:treslin-like n=1 Tax=Tachypleus tridentatus TaxID=6853 RepID=UPI003FCF506E
MVHKSVNTQKRNISTKYKQLGDVEFCKSSQKIQEVAKGQSDKKQIISSTDLTGQGFTDENQLVSHLKEVYNMAIEGETSLLSSVQTLVNLVLYFVKDKKQFEVAARELMDKHFLLSAKQINTKYEENLEPGAKNKRIKEYKIQALFALEMEAAMPSESTVEETVKKIVGLLRTMSFLSGPSVLNEFLLETVKDKDSNDVVKLGLMIDRWCSGDLHGDSNDVVKLGLMIDCWFSGDLHGDSNDMVKRGLMIDCWFSEDLHRDGNKVIKLGFLIGC